MRVVEQKKEQNILDNIFTFAGHGYHSESLSAWESYLLTLRDMFPNFYRPGGGVIKNLYHTMNTELKEIVLTELQDPALDMALFHAHGAEDTQYLLGSPPINTVVQNVEAAKVFLRSKLRAAKRRGKSLAETKLYYMEAHGIPLDWFEGAFDDSVMAADSLTDWKLDIHIEDIQQISPQAEFLVFDECFNGSFVTAPYVAGSYVFGSGTTVAGMANSVNVLQDIWVDEYLGLLGLGVRFGLWHQSRNYLETHIIGDPTYHFAATSDLNLNQLMVQQANAPSTWEALLTNASPSIRMLAVAKVFHAKGADFESELVDIYHTDFSVSVRLEVIKCLAELRSPVFENLLKETLVDPAEIIRRMTISLMGDVGYEAYLPIMAKQMIMDPSDRINFKGKGAITKIDPVNGQAACEKYIDSMPEVASKTVMKKALAHSFSGSQVWMEDGLLAKIADDSLKMKKRISSVRTFRNYRFHKAVPTLISMAEDTTMDAKLRTAIIEALGWFTYSYNRNLIIDACTKLAVNSDQPDMVRNEALKTKNRLLTGPNNTLTP
ncbi:HEAT repeat domain-containing protein [bacterium]|nr:HEAT repeat domain-containing protein [bacterium]